MLCFVHNEMFSYLVLAEATSGGKLHSGVSGSGEFVGSEKKIKLNILCT